MLDELLPIYGDYLALLYCGVNPSNIGDILNATTIV
jgi:hypothetical protein